MWDEVVEVKRGRVVTNVVVGLLIAVWCGVIGMERWAGRHLGEWDAGVRWVASKVASEKVMPGGGYAIEGSADGSWVKGWVVAGSGKRVVRLEEGRFGKVVASIAVDEGRNEVKLPKGRFRVVEMYGDRWMGDLVGFGAGSHWRVVGESIDVGDGVELRL